MTLGELREQLSKLTVDRAAPIELHGDARLRGKMKCEECGNSTRSEPFEVSFGHTARIGYIEQVGGRVIVHFSQG
jgi:hypothetical protein